jgi:hypothetical protein
MMDINKWAADKCGIKIVSQGETAPFWTDDKEPVELVNSEWTMQDARCRELVVEHFKIDTEYYQHAKVWEAAMADDYGIYGGREATRSEAEIACIEAIMKADV